jgi:putative tricarboxylic transport membrane protein
VFGSYSVQNSMSDVYVMMALGTGMYFLERFGFSAAPLVLGLILGPIAESNFTQGSMIAGAMYDGWTAKIQYFMGGTLNLVLIALVIASIGYSFLSHRAEGRAARAGVTA